MQLRDFKGIFSIRTWKVLRTPGVSRLESFQWKALSANLCASHRATAKKLFNPYEAHYQINKYKPTGSANITSTLAFDKSLHKEYPNTAAFLVVSWMFGVDSPLISWCHCSVLFSVSECLCFCHFPCTGGAINLKCSVNVQHSMLGFSLYAADNRRLSVFNKSHDTHLWFIQHTVPPLCMTERGERLFHMQRETCICCLWLLEVPLWRHLETVNSTICLLQTQANGAMQWVGFHVSSTIFSCVLCTLHTYKINTQRPTLAYYCLH